jgi:cytidylate kinase
MNDGTGRRIVIAIDGPAGAGKSTLARRLAARVGFTYVDTGAMYRAIALSALREKIDPSDAARMEQLARSASVRFEPGSSRVWLNGEDVTEAIRAPEVSAAASIAAAGAGVRRAMVLKQREMAASTSVVMEGRDIGSVVFPDADVKVFLDADEEERVRRRVAELKQRQALTPESEMAVGVQLKERDARDQTRKEAPLVRAPKAVYLDSSRLSIEEVEEAVLKLVRQRIANGREKN